jgi:hypothetical protein
VLYPILLFFMARIRSISMPFDFIMFTQKGIISPFFRKPLSAAAGSILNVDSVFLQQDISVLLTDPIRRGDIVVFYLQPLDDFFGGLIGRVPAFSVKIGHDVVQTNDAYLRIIEKFQHAPANWGQRGDSPIHSSFVFMLRNAVSVLWRVLRRLGHILIFFFHIYPLDSGFLLFQSE